jgi:hypothetical protein
VIDTKAIIKELADIEYALLEMKFLTPSLEAKLAKVRNLIREFEAQGKKS